jgi:hypothetical protein
VRTRRHRQQGIILFVAVLMLALMGALAISSLDSAARDQQSAGYYNRSNTALFAAEAGVSAAKAHIISNACACPCVLPWAPSTASPVYVGDTSAWSYFGGLPRYYADPLATNPIECVGKRKMAGGSLNIGTSTAQWLGQWQIRVVGQSPDGSLSRLEVMYEAITP